MYVKPLLQKVAHVTPSQKAPALPPHYRQSNRVPLSFGLAKRLAKNDPFRARSKRQNVRDASRERARKSMGWVRELAHQPSGIRLMSPYDRLELRKTAEYRQKMTLLALRKAVVVRWGYACNG